MFQRFVIWKTLAELAELISAKDLAEILALKINSVGPRLTEMSRLNLVDWHKQPGTMCRLWTVKPGVDRFPLNPEPWAKASAMAAHRNPRPEPIVLGELYAAKARPQTDILSTRSLPPIPVVHTAAGLPPVEKDSFVADVIAHIDMLSETDLKTLVESLQVRTFKRLRQIVLEN